MAAIESDVASPWTGALLSSQLQLQFKTDSILVKLIATAPGGGPFVASLTR